MKFRQWAVAWILAFILRRRPGREGEIRGAMDRAFRHRPQRWRDTVWDAARTRALR